MRFLERFWFGCSHCHGEHDCPLIEGVDPESVGAHDHGPPVVGAVILVFILPLATALGGAYLAGEWWARESSRSLAWWQVAGAAAGFFVGIGLARLALWTHRRFSSAEGGVE